MYEIDDIYEEMSRQFESINEEVSALLSSQRRTLKSIKDLSSKEPPRAKKLTYEEMKKKSYYS